MDLADEIAELSAEDAPVEKLLADLEQVPAQRALRALVRAVRETQRRVDAGRYYVTAQTVAARILEELVFLNARQVFVRVPEIAAHVFGPKATSDQIRKVRSHLSNIKHEGLVGNDEQRGAWHPLERVRRGSPARKSRAPSRNRRDPTQLAGGGAR